jgi:hypothetical protein
VGVVDEIGKLERSDFRIIAPETMPELGRVQELISDIYMDFLGRRSTGSVILFFILLSPSGPL